MSLFKMPRYESESDMSLRYEKIAIIWWSIYIPSVIILRYFKLIGAIECGIFTGIGLCFLYISTKEYLTTKKRIRIKIAEQI